MVDVAALGEAAQKPVERCEALPGKSRFEFLVHRGGQEGLGRAPGELEKCGADL